MLQTRKCVLPGFYARNLRMQRSRVAIELTRADESRLRHLGNLQVSRECFQTLCAAGIVEKLRHS